MKNNRRSACLLLLLCAFVVCLRAQDQVCVPEDYGAHADGVNKDTAAIQSAIDACARAGGGVVRLAAGTYLSAPVTLKSKITLEIAAGATLLGSSDFEDYHGAGYDPQKGGPLAALVNATQQSDVAITGGGTIDGAGAVWWDAVRAARQNGQPDPARPRLVTFSRCQRVRVQGITLTNSPSFHIVPSQCENVVVDGVTILAPADSPNTDGIDPAASRNVRIMNCTIDTGDDNIAVKSGSDDAYGRGAAAENIIIADNTFLHGHGVSIGSETNGGVRNVQVQRCVFHGTDNGFRIKSYRGAGGDVSQINYSDSTMYGVGNAILFSEYYPKIPSADPGQPLGPLTPAYHDIRVINVTATNARSAGVIVGVPESPVSNVVLQNVSIEAANPLVVRNASVKTSNTAVDFAPQENAQISDYVDQAPPADIVVAADGTGDFRTVQGAIDSIPENNSVRVVIRVKPGVYYEQIRIPRNKPFVTLRGDNAAGTVLVYDASAATAGGTSKSGSVYVQSNDFVAENITFENSYGTGSQAVAFYITADRAILRNSRFIGWQDTLYANGVGCAADGNCTPGRQYYQNCYIEGSVDFIFGDAAAVFDGCRIESKAAGYVTAQSKTYPAQYSGYVLWNSRLTGANTGAGVYLGRPWRAYATVMYLNCELGSHIRPPGWSIWSGTDNHLTATYGEYQSTGPGANPGARVPWSHQLSDAEAAQYAISVFLAGSDGWDPTQ